MNPNPELQEADRLARARAGAFFAGTLGPGELEPLFAHLRGCAPCAAHFDAVREAYAELGRPGPVLARHEADLIERQLLEGIAPARALAWTRLIRPWPWVAGFAAAAAALLLVLRPVPTQPDVFQTRGAPAAASIPVQALCLRRGAHGIDVQPVATHGGSCPVGGYLMLASGIDPLPPALAAAVRDGSGALLLRGILDHPKPRSLFDGNIPLQHAGTLTVVALALNQPLPPDQLDAALTGGTLPQGAKRELVEVEVTP